MSNKQGIIFDDGVLYRHGENGSSVWLEDGDEKKDGRYIISTNSQTLANVLIAFTKDDPTTKREWKDGKYHGHGTFTYPDGIMYVGEFKDGLKNGQGTLTSPYGENYEGKFKDGGKLYQKLRLQDR